MRFGEIKIILTDFYSYEIGALESYFEEMALKGWMLDKVTRLYIKFKRMEPKNIKYTIDIVDGISENHKLDEKLALEYREKLLNLGWNYSCEFNKLQVFYKENAYEKNKVSKKGKEEIKLIFDNSLGNLIIKILFIALIVLNTLASIFRGRDLDYFTDNSNIVGLFIVSDLLLLYLIDLYKLIKFRVSDNAKKQSTLWIRLKGVLINLIFLVGIIELFIILFESNTEDFHIKLVILSSFIGVALLLSFIQNKRDSIKKKLVIATCFVITIVVISLFNNFIVSNIFKNKNNLIKNKEYLLSLKDFNDEVSSEYDIYVDEESSFIANKLFYTANGKNMKLSYELFESDYKFMVNWNFNKMIKWFENQGIYYNEIKSNLPNDVMVYTNEKENNYILLSSNKLIELIGLDEVTDKEELLNIVYNKIFKDKEENVV